MTILTGLILLYWLLINTVHVFKTPGMFNTFKSDELLQDSSGNYPEFEIPLEKLFMSYNMTSTRIDTINADNIQNYMVGLWF